MCPRKRKGSLKFGYGIDDWDMLPLDILKKLFSSLFTKCDVSSIHCDVCELVKNHHTSVPLSLNKSPLPFYGDTL